MLKIKDEGIILEKTDLEFENKAVFNPACIQVGDITHMFYRAINQNDISSIGYCQLVDNKVVKRLDKPVLFPEDDYEKMGAEDPRITLLDGTYYLFYTAYGGKTHLFPTPRVRIFYISQNRELSPLKSHTMKLKISFGKQESVPVIHCSKGI
jgi:predicted GH43/DUF377 family glycosyl hydrolase